MALIKFNERYQKAHKKKRKDTGYKSINLLLEPSPKQWWEDPDALVAFNIPRISARLERLMGTNVVRLTDRKYMRELRERLDEDYRKQLSNRIRGREIKELERERNLILEGKTDAIPHELASDPIFVCNKEALIEIIKRRAKLKTNREKHAERLQRQGVKWERERFRHEEEEYQKQLELGEIRRHQKKLEARYMKEDEERGLDLLRINDTEWQDCEQSLRNFLESERNRMKERSWRIPTQFSSDPKDIQNVIRARKAFREQELARIRMEKLNKNKPKVKVPKDRYTRAMRKAARMAKAVGQFQSHWQKTLDDDESQVSIYLGDDAASDLPSSTPSMRPYVGKLSQIEQETANEMNAIMEADVQKGYLVTSDQFRNLRYDDPQIARLREATHLREIYNIAERIVTCTMIEEEPMGEEEMLVEDDDQEDM